jgi:hypothetical protein
MKKHVVRVSLIAAILCGILMVTFNHFQKKSEAECISFLVQSGFSKERLSGYDNLLERGLIEDLPRHLDGGSASKGSTLLQKHRSYAYWSAVSRGIAEVALLVLIVLGLRELCKKITVPGWLYRKLWSDPD